MPVLGAAVPAASAGESQGRERRPRMSSTTTDVVIVGGVVSGLSIALQLKTLGVPRVTAPKIDLEMGAWQTKASHRLHRLHRFVISEICVIYGRRWIFVRHRVRPRGA